MRSLTPTVAAFLAAALLTGCDAGSGPLADNASGFAAAATDHNVVDHFKSVSTETFSDVVNPCNGEQIILTGTVRSEMTVVGSREMLDAGSYLHIEFQQQVRATGTGSATGATYIFSDIFHGGFNLPNGPAPHFTLSEIGSGRVTTAVPGLSFKAHSVVHGVLPSGKDFKVTTTVDRVTCS